MMSLFEISIVECTSIVNKISFKCETLQKLEKCQSREGDDVSAAALERTSQQQNWTKQMEHQDWCCYTDLLQNLENRVLANPMDSVADYYIF